MSLMMISTGEIHLWYVYNDKITDPQLLSKYLDILNDDERIQQKRFHFEKHRHQYLLTRAMVRSVLTLYVNTISPDAWQFKKNSYGKPFICNSSLSLPLCFNISHTDNLIVMAVALNQEVGVDVEYLPRRGNVLDIANSFFSPTEVKNLFDLPPEKQINRFFDLWTLKEAYIKACGMGLSIPLDHFGYSFSDIGEISIDFNSARNDQPELWQFWQIHPSDTHKVSMAVKSDNIGTAYKISMKEIVPLSDVMSVDYSIAHGRIINV